MKRLSIIILVFSVAFLLLFMAPALFGMQFRPYPLMKIGDVLDILTPLVLLPLYWLLYRLDPKKAITLSEGIIFAVLAALWVEGQGMHLAANSVGHLLKGMETTDMYNLTFFYDEVLSHYLWHFGVVGLSAVLIYRQWRNPFAEGRTMTWAVILAGIIHGFSYFMIIIEGATAPLGVTFSVLAVLFMLIYGRKSLTQQPIILFFLAAYLLAILLFAGWGIYWGGLPEFSKVGIID